MTHGLIHSFLNGFSVCGVCSESTYKVMRRWEQFAPGPALGPSFSSPQLCDRDDYRTRTHSQTEQAGCHLLSKEPQPWWLSSASVALGGQKGGPRGAEREGAVWGSWAAGLVAYLTTTTAKAASRLAAPWPGLGRHGLRWPVGCAGPSPGVCQGCFVGRQPCPFAYLMFTASRAE